MSSPSASISRQEVSALLRQVQGNQLFNRQLSSVCQVNGLKSTGVKADLQRRIVDLIQEAVNANDAARFLQVRQSILNACTQRSSPASKNTASRGGNSAPAAAQFTAATIPPLNTANAFPPRGYHSGTGAVNGYAANSSYGSATSALSFRPSPFYKIETLIGTVRVCDAMSQHRHTITVPIVLTDQPALQRCVDDASYRVMVFCSGEPTGVQDVAFPHQSELRVNGGEIKANLRGLKNKPGSTRPVDITGALRLRPTYINRVEFTYALTQKKYFLAAHLCKTTSVSELVGIISTRRRIPKDLVVAELNKKAQDPDVVATSQVLSLKCPLSYMRLVTPCRSFSCTHIQCFDATSYLQLQEQGPQWLCPICNKSAPFEQLAVDGYAKDILENTPQTLETVTIEPNGRWLVKSSQDDVGVGANGTAFDDDDLVEISDVNNVGGRRFETPNTATPKVSTPASSGRGESASGPRGAGSASAKRPAPTIIDLTADSDDEEATERPRKRQSTATNGTGPSSGLAMPGTSPFGL